MGYIPQILKLENEAPVWSYYVSVHPEVVSNSVLDINFFVTPSFFFFFSTVDGRFSSDFPRSRWSRSWSAAFAVSCWSPWRHREELPTLGHVKEIGHMFCETIG